ncbi:D-amino-acid:oxygen oxidoreductase [Fodinibius roseus]|uniref:D-amino-acid oxidase n=1 Tax=Fodinibius roseus TaxID=1194090 RepID=A0A1M5BZP1_9BACT|nr:FAD-dependent oxidoreductase [Fodinibius roseus]SHF47911.1 D-amino-acid:oxygen oxidoreductase [Fodinibius roseus]
MNFDKIIVIGSGVSGLTTALTLQLLGYETVIYTDKEAGQISDKNAHPEFASLFPAASVIPHSFYSDQLKELFRTSQSFFYELRKRFFSGLSIHRHFEIFEFEQDEPEYRNWMLDFHPVMELSPQEIPRRSCSQNLYGWAFNCIFADWPRYFPALTACYKQSGGHINRRTVRTEDLPTLPADILVNCSGTGSLELFDDPLDEQLVMRGHLLHKPGAPLIIGAGGNIISYNYTPKASVYSDPSGEACDVYCYPREDGWMLGGSRETGYLSSPTTEFSKKNAESYQIGGLAIPSAIIDINKDILETTYHQSLRPSDELYPFIGYRYVRNKEEGLRLDHETMYGKTVYHNYGHGGAGATLSWGCALDLASRITSKNKPRLQELLLEEFEHIL